MTKAEILKKEISKNDDRDSVFLACTSNVKDWGF